MFYFSKEGTVILFCGRLRSIYGITGLMENILLIKYYKFLSDE